MGPIADFIRAVFLVIVSYMMEQKRYLRQFILVSSLQEKIKVYLECVPIIDLSELRIMMDLSSITTIIQFTLTVQ